MFHSLFAAVEKKNSCLISESFGITYQRSCLNRIKSGQAGRPASQYLLHIHQLTTTVSTDLQLITQ